MAEDFEAEAVLVPNMLCFCPDEVFSIRLEFEKLLMQRRKAN